MGIKHKKWISISGVVMRLETFFRQVCVCIYQSHNVDELLYIVIQFLSNLLIDLKKESLIIHKVYRT